MTLLPSRVEGARAPPRFLRAWERPQSLRLIVDDQDVRWAGHAAVYGGTSPSARLLLLPEALPDTSCPSPSYPPAEWLPCRRARRRCAADGYDPDRRRQRGPARRPCRSADDAGPPLRPQSQQRAGGVR